MSSASSASAGTKRSGHGDDHLENPSASKRTKIDKKHRLYLSGKRHEFCKEDHNTWRTFKLVLETDRPIVDMGWMEYMLREIDEDGSLISSTRGAYILFDNGKVKQWGYDYERWANSLSNTFLSQVAQLCCTVSHGAAARSDGSVVTWGYNDESQLGRTTDKPNAFHLPERVPKMTSHFVTQVACTELGTIALTKNGDVFSWGQNIQGESGIPGNPTRIDGLPPVKQIAASDIGKAGAVTEDGDVYVWGKIYRNNGPSTPVLVEGELPRKKIKEICCERHFTGAVSTDGLVYAWSSKFAKLVESLKFVKIGSICGRTSYANAIIDNHLIAVSDDRSRLFSCENYDRERCYFRKTEEIPKSTFSGKVSKLFALGFVSAFVTEPSENECDEQQFNSPNLFDNPESHPDIKFTINGDVSCSAHKCILSTRSTYFQNLFAAGMKESKQTELEVNEFSKDIFVRVIQFIYESKFDNIEAHALPSLLEAADFYCLDDLKEKCLKVLTESITTQNVGELLQAFDNEGNSACKDICMSFLVKNGKEWASQKKYTSQVTSTNLWAEICNALIE